MKCPNCGSEVLAGQKFCTHCGFDLEEYSKSMSQQNNNFNQPTAPVQNQQPTDDIKIQYQSETQSNNFDYSNNTDFTNNQNYSAPQPNQMNQNIQSNNNNFEQLFKNNIPYLVFVGIFVVLFLFLEVTWALIPLVLGLGYLAYEYFVKHNSESTALNNQVKHALATIKAQGHSDFFSDKRQKNLLMIGSGAGVVHLIAIFFLPFIALSSFITPFASQIRSFFNTFSESDGLSARLLQLFHNGDLSIFNLNTFAKQLKPIVELDPEATSQAFAETLGYIPIIFYVLTAIMLVVVLMFFIKKYASIVFFVTGTASTLFYALIYFSAKDGIADMAIEQELFALPSVSSFIGLGFYLGLLASIVLIVVGVLGLIKPSNKAKKVNMTNVQA